jgi:hypothetical protein
VDPDNTWARPLAAGVRIYVEVQGRPLHRYAVTLQLLTKGYWQTIFLFDNAHGGHDMHRYTGGTKQPAERFMEGDSRDVLPAAITFLVNHWEAIVESWKS